MQFDDEFVKKHFSGRFETAEELKKSLLASTAMERVQALDMALGEAVQQVRKHAYEQHKHHAHGTLAAPSSWGVPIVVTDIMSMLS